MSSGGKPKLPPPPEPVEQVQTVTETAQEESQRRKKKIATGGRQATILSGIQSALKARLGQ